MKIAVVTLFHDFLNLFTERWLLDLLSCGVGFLSKAALLQKQRADAMEQHEIKLDFEMRRPVVEQVNSLKLVYKENNMEHFFHFFVLDFIVMSWIIFLKIGLSLNHNRCLCLLLCQRI